MSAATNARTFTDHLNWSIRLFKAGLRDVHIHVLGSLIEALEVTGGLADGETTVQLSRWELAQRTGLSTQQVQRALSHLVTAGYIVRNQLTKKDGEVSRTLLTARAVEAMGLEGGADLSGSAPPELVNFLIGEVRPVIDAVVTAWNNHTLPNEGVVAAFRGGPRAWAQVEFLLTARMEEHLHALSDAQVAAEAAHEAESRGEYLLSLPDGQVVGLTAAPFHTSGNTPALRSVDMRFVRDTLSLLAIRQPGMVREETLPRLVAEVAYSRSAGFVYRHDAAAAIKVLASCIARPGWSRPRKIDSRWYDLACGAVRPQVDRI
nr:helix-turn-helix domain-containing protein [Nitrosomonas nitrosa]